MELQDYYILSALIFSIGLIITLTKKNAIVVLMGIELMLNAANINFVAISGSPDHHAGQFFALFVIVVAAAEAAVALAIVVKLYQHFNTANVDRFNDLKG